MMYLKKQKFYLMKNIKMKKIYLIGIWWIWISAIARYYNQNWYEVYWSDSSDSELIKNLKNEWIDIIIWNSWERITNDIEKVIYTEAIKNDNKELIKAKELWIKTISYPESVAEIANQKKLVAICWTHWKSTTTSMASILLKNSNENFTSIVWTILKEFNNKNFFHRNELKNNDEYFLLEACEYKRSFLKYEPSVVIVTNIEIDHLDYYKNIEDYISAYRQLIDNMKTWWFVILNWQESNSRQLIWQRKDVNYIVIDNDKFSFNWQEFLIPKLDIKIPGEHIYYDASLVYILWQMIWIQNSEIIKSLSMYNWVWRRMEEVWQTKNDNLLLSDYWHHPTEITFTLESIKEKYKDKKILTVYQPHQYNRTIELLDWFKNVFKNTDILIVPNIYESRDSEDDKKNMNTEIFLENINHENKINWNWLDNTFKIIEKFDNENKDLLIVLMWAWDVDNLRYELIK